MILRAAIVLVAACGHQPSAQPDAAIACDSSQLALVSSNSEYFVAIVDAGAPAYLLLDTGSDLTFLQVPIGSPDPTPDAGTIELACSEVTLIGRPEVPLAPIAGIPTLGQLGTDHLLAQPTEIDLASSVLRFNAPGAPFADATAWPFAPFDVVQGLVLPHVALDGVAVRLMFDTGSANTLWLGQQPEPGDVEVDMQDAEGNIVPGYLGTATLTIGTWQGSVVVTRVPSWPYFEQTVQDLGGNIFGLLGLSAIGAGVVLDGDQILRVDQQL